MAFGLRLVRHFFLSFFLTVLVVAGWPAPLLADCPRSTSWIALASQRLHRNS